MRLAAVLSVALLLCGCSASPFGSSAQLRQVPDGLQLTAQPSSAAAGGSATLTLHNGAAEPIGHNLCFAALERLRGGLWVPAVSAAKGCPVVFSSLWPGQRASAQSPLPSTLVTDDYRFVTRVYAPLGSVPPEQVRSDRLVVFAAGG